MSISLTCDCGKRLSVKDEMLGRRVKCPVCQGSLTVPDGESATGERPPKKKGANMSGGKKNNTTLWIAAGAGVLLLGFCCLGIGGAGAWFFLLRGPSTDNRLVGKWVPDVDPGKKIKTADDVAALFGGDIQFKSDGTVIDNTPMTPFTQGKWKTVSTSGNVVTVELSQGPVSRKLDVKIVDNDHLKITPADTKVEFSFKRST
jgi:hypothetical protein